MGNLSEMRISEFTGVFNYLLDNNKELQENKGLTPIAIGIEGAAGIGKTAVVEEVAKERGMTFCKLSLSQLEEVGDLCGFPMKEVKLQWKAKDGTTKTKWWPESMIDRVPQGVSVTNQTRMSYAPPAWLPSEENPNGCILLLDDYTRKIK